jgi:ADP-L-glycero-D-manno-heptose 6-epimerase
MSENKVIKKKKIINYYALSKFMFDKYVHDNKKKIKCAIGLRYFNVYGPNEHHKKNMSSPILTFYNQIQKNNFCKIFGKYDGFGDGEHTRDFIYVNDVVNINLWAAKKKFVDIINVGTGISSSFNFIANTIIKKLKKGKIEYIKFPSQFKGKYQSYTKANILMLRKLGYKKKLTNITEGISKYLKILTNE